MLHSLRRAKLYQSKVQAFSQNGKIIQKSESEQDHHSVIKQKQKLVSISWIWLNWIDLGSLVWISLNQFEFNWFELNWIELNRIANQPGWRDPRCRRQMRSPLLASSSGCCEPDILDKSLQTFFRNFLGPASSSTLILPPPQPWSYLLLKLVSFGLILSFDLLKVGDPRLCVRRLVRQLLHLLLDAVHLSSAIWTHVWKLGRYIWQFGQFWT